MNLLKIKLREISPRMYKMCIYGGVFLFFIVLFSLLPLAGDDYYFHTPSSVAAFLDQQKQLYLTENGRVLGNTFAYLFADLGLVSVIFKSLIILGIFANIMMLFPKRNNVLFLVACFLFIAVPAPLFAQTYAWNAGFYNYVPPVLLLSFSLRVLLQHFMLNKKLGIFEDILLVFSGFCGCLFVEFCTTYAAILGITAVILSFVFWHKFSKSCLLYAVSAALGTLLMFSSPVYHNVAENTDQYRTMAFSLSAILKQARINYEIVSTHTIGANILLYFLLCIACYILTVKLVHSKAEKIILSGIYTIVPVYFICSCWLLKTNFSITSSFSALIIDVLMCFVFFVSILYVIINYIPLKQYRWNGIFLMISILVLNGPLLIVTPIGPRCFFASYIFLIGIVLNLIALIMNLFDYKWENLFLPCFLSALMAAGIYLFIGYHQWRVQDQTFQYIERKMDEGEMTIVLPQYEYSAYIHEPETEKIGRRYYYIEMYDINWKYIPYKEWYYNYYENFD